MNTQTVVIPDEYSSELKSIISLIDEIKLDLEEKKKSYIINKFDTNPKMTSINPNLKWAHQNL